MWPRDNKTKAYLSFCRITCQWLGAYLLLLNGDSSPSQGCVHCYKLLYLSVPPGHWGEEEWEQRLLPKNTAQCPQPGLKSGSLAPESSALTITWGHHDSHNQFFFSDQPCAEKKIHDCTDTPVFKLVKPQSIFKVCNRCEAQESECKPVMIHCFDLARVC